MKKIMLALALAAGIASAQAGEMARSLFPMPDSVAELSDQPLLLPADAAISNGAGPVAADAAGLLRQWLLPAASASSEGPSVAFVADTSLPAEGYRLSAAPGKGVTLAASSPEGFVWALQTLRQISRRDTRGNLEVEAVEIVDAPATSWRCFMLDSGRERQQIATLEKYIDMASLLKLNRFHWHLSEGLGFRPEIAKWPLAAQVGGFVSPDSTSRGMYTRAEMEHIVDYARRRGVMVVPEIDIPGHAEALLNAYPELGCTGEKPQVPKVGFTQNILCAGRDSTILFLHDVLDEICSIFPGDYVHIGGDEAPKGNWEKCPRCQERISALGLADESELQMWLAADLAQYLKDKGRKCVMWEDVIRSGNLPLPDNVVIQWWNYRGHKTQGVEQALEKGLHVVCSPNFYCYLNFPTVPWAGYAEDRTCGLDDVAADNRACLVLEQRREGVDGMSCCLWTDYGVKDGMIDRRVFPAILALADQMWHSGAQTTSDTRALRRRVDARRPFLEELGYEFGPYSAAETPEGYSWE